MTRSCPRPPLALAAALAAGALSAAGCGPSLGKEYVGGLSVTAIAPAEGFTQGGTLVTISGTRLCADLTVTVDGVGASSVEWASEDRATAHMPPHARGEALVTVACGRARAAAKQPYRYVPNVNLRRTSVAPPAAGFADLDGDGLPDAIAIPDQLAVRRGLPGFGFEPAEGDPASAAAQAGAGALLQVADFTAEGTPDVMVFEPLEDGALRCRLFAGEDDLAEAGQSEVRSGQRLRLLRVADLDGDGHPDLVVGQEGVPAGRAVVAVAHGRGGVQFEPPQQLFTIAASADQLVELLERRRQNARNGGLATADFDGDGLADLALNEGGPDWQLVPGSRERRYAVHPITLSPGDGLVFFDRDGIPDRYAVELATASSPSRVVRIWRGTAPGAFETSPRVFTVDCGESLCPELTEPGVVPTLYPRRFDLDADGDGEFLSGSRLPSGPDQLAWIELGAAGSAGLDLGSVADDAPSALLESEPGTLALVLPGRETERFLAPAGSAQGIAQFLWPPIGHTSGASCLGRFSGAGAADLLTVREGAALVLAGDGDGWFARTGRTFPIRGDGCTPARFTSGPGDDFYTSEAVYLNQGAGRFLEWIPPLPAAAAGGVTYFQRQDVDGDGIDELEVAVPGARPDLPDVHVFHVGPRGFAEVGVARGVDARGGVRPVVADLNGDGFLDQVRCQGKSLSLLYGDAAQRDGAWGEGPSWELYSSCTSVTLVQVPAGRLIVASDGTALLERPTTTTARRTASDGTTLLRTEREYGHTNSSYLARLRVEQHMLCDLRGRGKTDLPAIDAGAGTVAVLKEVLDSPGTYDYSRTWPLGSTDVRFVGCADVDGDGLDDLVIDAGGHPILVRNGSD